VSTQAQILRAGEAFEVDAKERGPGDIVVLESEGRVPGDLRLLQGRDLEIDESLLTGESVAVLKQARSLLPADAALGDRSNMAFAGTRVTRGRGSDRFADRTGPHCRGGARYTPWISDVLRIEPVSLEHWTELLGMALVILLSMELNKLVRKRLASHRQDFPQSFSAVPNTGSVGRFRVTNWLVKVLLSTE